MSDLNGYDKKDIDAAVKVLSNYALAKDRVMHIEYRADSVVAAMIDFSTQETAPLQERIDELEGALRGLMNIADFSNSDIEHLKQAHNKALQALNPQRQ